MCFRGKLRGSGFGHYSKLKLFEHKTGYKKVKVLYLRTNKALSLARKEGFEISKRCKIKKMRVKECSVFNGLRFFL